MPELSMLDALRHLIENEHVGPSELQRRSGVDRTTIWRWLSNKTTPPLDKFESVYSAAIDIVSERNSKR